MTNPGQSTPWGKLPIPSEGKTPDVPVDLAGLADPIDTLLKNVIGGSVAPSGPLSPSLIEASASIGSLNSTQSSQQGQITTLNGQVTQLSVSPWAAVAYRESGYSIAGNKTTPYSVISYQIPPQTQTCLLMMWSTVSMGWVDTTTAALRSRLQIRPDGSTTYSDRIQCIESGNAQTLNCFHMETVAAGKSPRAQLTVEVYGAATSTKTAEAQEFGARIFLIMLPWRGPAVAFPGL
ncbi:hypothetical protein [Streptomyces microflavus]|uniref:hypothetical protein n=1 Tax=Streptomyces microflavus TaxID=1919 RepID=UPI0033A3261A